MRSSVSWSMRDTDFLASRRTVVNADVDELVVTKDKVSIFELVSRSETGYLKYPGYWIESATKSVGKYPPPLRFLLSLSDFGRIATEMDSRATPLSNTSDLAPSSGFRHGLRRAVVLGVIPTFSSYWYRLEISTRDAGDT